MVFRRCARRMTEPRGCVQGQSNSPPLLLLRILVARWLSRHLLPQMFHDTGFTHRLFILPPLPLRKAPPLPAKLAPTAIRMSESLAEAQSSTATDAVARSLKMVLRFCNFLEHRFFRISGSDCNMILVMRRSLYYHRRPTLVLPLLTSSADYSLLENHGRRIDCFSMEWCEGYLYA